MKEEENEEMRSRGEQNGVKWLEVGRVTLASPSPHSKTKDDRVPGARRI